MKTKSKPPGETPGCTVAATGAATPGDSAFTRRGRLLPLNEWMEDQGFVLAIVRLREQQCFSSFPVSGFTSIFMSP
jgi:hypothetical protein